MQLSAPGGMSGHSSLAGEGGNSTCDEVSSAHSPPMDIPSDSASDGDDETGDSDTVLNITDSSSDDNNGDVNSKLPVVCSVFYKESSTSAITIDVLPFIIVLRNGERISSLIRRIRHRLNLRSEWNEKYRLTVLPGPISPQGSDRTPFVPTQESLAAMRNYAHIIPTTVAGGEENTIELSEFLPSPELLAQGVRNSRLRFGLRPWLGIEMPFLGRKGGNMFNVFPNIAVPTAGVPDTAAKRKVACTPTPRSLASEKPIRIFN